MSLSRRGHSKMGYSLASLKCSAVAVWLMVLQMRKLVELKKIEGYC